MTNLTDTGAGTPIVWIHGFPLAGSVFENQLTIRGVRHLVPDLPGFGSSTPPSRSMSMEEYARVAIELLDERRIERAVFAGVSMGGYVCFSAVRIAPERVAGLILIDTRETADAPEARKGRIDSAEVVKREGTGSVVESMLPKMLTPKAPDELRVRVREIMSSASRAGTVEALHAMAKRSDSSPLLPALRIPTLVIVGSEDTITPVADSQRMAQAIPGAKLVVLENAAHLSMMEQPEAFNAAVEGFLKSLR